MLIERWVTKHLTVYGCVTTMFLRDGIVLGELREQKCQQHVCQHTDVVQTGQAGWMVLILQCKMVKFKWRSALVIVYLSSRFANTQQRFLWKNCGSYFIYKLHHPPGCDSRYCSTDWMRSKYTWRSKRTHKSLRNYMCVRFLTCDLLNLSSLSWTLSADFNFGGKQVFISL